MQSIDADYLSFIWDSVLKYLSTMAEIDVIRAHLSSPAYGHPRSLRDVYRQLLGSMRNRQGMPNTISSLEDLEICMYEFNPKAVLSRYESNWAHLFDEISSRVQPKSRMDKRNSRSYWVIFCKGAISGAQFLGQFIDVHSFDKFVLDFDESPNTRPALPLLLATEIFGMGFALSCDFLKELGYINFSKPDTHLKYILSKLGISSGSDIDILRTVSIMAEVVKESPYAIDKALWLIGSGNLYLTGNKLSTDRKQFVEETFSNWVKRSG